MKKTTYFSLAWPSEGTVEPFPLAYMPAPPPRDQQDLRLSSLLLSFFFLFFSSSRPGVNTRAVYAVQLVFLTSLVPRPRQGRQQTTRRKASNNDDESTNTNTHYTHSLTHTHWLTLCSYYDTSLFLFAFTKFYQRIFFFFWLCLKNHAQINYLTRSRASSAPAPPHPDTTLTRNANFFLFFFEMIYLLFSITLLLSRLRTQFTQVTILCRRFIQILFSTIEICILCRYMYT